MAKVILWTEMTMANTLGWFSGNPDEDFGNVQWGSHKPTLEELQEEHGIDDWADVEIRHL
jgi:hypothetical protein